MGDLSAEAHERGLAQFIDARRRGRFADALSAGGMARAKETARLPHSTDLDARWVVDPVGGDPVLAVAQQLEAIAGDPEEAMPSVAYIVSDDSEFDGASMPWREALDHGIVHSCAAPISIIPGSLAIYFGELAKDARVLSCPAP